MQYILYCAGDSLNGGWLVKFNSCERDKNWQNGTTLLPRTSARCSGLNAAIVSSNNVKTKEHSVCAENLRKLVAIPIRNHLRRTIRDFFPHCELRVVEMRRAVQACNFSRQLLSLTTVKEGLIGRYATRTIPDAPGIVLRPDNDLRSIVQQKHAPIQAPPLAKTLSNLAFSSSIFSHSKTPIVGPCDNFNLRGNPPNEYFACTGQGGIRSERNYSSSHAQVAQNACALQSTLCTRLSSGSLSTISSTSFPSHGRLAVQQSFQPRSYATKMNKTKIKPYSSWKRRFKLLASGEFKRWRAGKRHNAKLLTPKQRRQLRRPSIVSRGLKQPMLKLGFTR